MAFNPTDKTVEEAADVTVRSVDLRDILPHILGKQHLSWAFRLNRKSGGGTRARSKWW